MNEKSLWPSKRGAGTTAPIRVVLTRDVDESEHIIEAVVRTVDSFVAVHGDPDRQVIPRSSMKPIQLIPLIRTGAADAFDVTPTELALASASHSAEVAHVEALESWLDRIGLDASYLECGSARPFSSVEADRRLAAGETFQPIHNCCSGKHVGLLTIARHLDIDPSGYIERSHPIQQLVIESIETFAGVSLAGESNGIDGCGIPTFSLTLDALAMSMARLADPALLESSFASAARRFVDALAAHPFWMSGSDRREMQLSEVASERLVTKTGAEGVFMAALPDRGVGIALKTLDGATRAANVAIAAVLESLEVIPPGHTVAPLTNEAGTVVGTMQAHLS